MHWLVGAPPEVVARVRATLADAAHAGGGARAAGGARYAA